MVELARWDDASGATSAHEHLQTQDTNGDGMDAGTPSWIHSLPWILYSRLCWIQGEDSRQSAFCSVAHAHTQEATWQGSPPVLDFYADGSYQACLSCLLQDPGPSIHHGMGLAERDHDRALRKPGTCHLLIARSQSCCPQLSQQHHPQT